VRETFFSRNKNPPVEELSGGFLRSPPTDRFWPNGVLCLASANVRSTRYIGRSYAIRELPSAAQSGSRRLQIAVTEVAV
jgi:hypothetical protein